MWYKYMKRRSNDFWCGILCLIFSMIYLFGCSQIAESKVHNTFHPNAIPIVFGVMLVILSLVLIARNLAPVEHSGNEAIEKRRHVRVLACFADFFLCWFLLETAGFVIAMFIFLAVLLMLLVPKGKRSAGKIILISVITSVGVYMLFLRGFNLILPRGIIGTALG